MLLAQDFYNLVNVYLDAVLHPNCINDEKTFAQEGWHLELKDGKVGLHPREGLEGTCSSSHLSSHISLQHYTRLMAYDDSPPIGCTYCHDMLYEVHSSESLQHCWLSLALMMQEKAG